MKIRNPEDLPKKHINHQKAGYIPLAYRIGAKEDIIINYTHNVMTVKQLAVKYACTVRTIQRLLKTHSRLRTHAEANKLSKPRNIPQNQ